MNSSLHSLLSIIISTKFVLIGLAGSTLLRFINLTIRWKYIGFDGEEKSWPRNSPRIIAFWHGHQLMMPWIFLRYRCSKSKRLYALISQHRDGRIVAQVMKFLGTDSVAGSSSRRGLASLYELIKKLKNGDHVAITPDGPKGPAYKIKGGLIKIAQRSKAPIYPSAIAAQSKWTFNSWDKMFLPKPFTKAILIMGEAIKVPSSLTSDELNQLHLKIEESINNLNLKAEKLINTQ